MGQRSNAIGEDMHLLLKWYFETAGSVLTRAVYGPATSSQCNVSSETGIGCRRALDASLARCRSVSSLRFHSRCLFRPRTFALLHLLWEAHFLPSHLLILMLFSGIYELCTPAAHLNSTMKWAFWLTSLLRTSSFRWMNLCLALYILERICFPVAGAVYGPLPTMHAVFPHFWTDRLVYRVSKKPAFALESAMV